MQYLILSVFLLRTISSTAKYIDDGNKYSVHSSGLEEIKYVSGGIEVNSSSAATSMCNGANNVVLVGGNCHGDTADDNLNIVKSEDSSAHTYVLPPFLH